MASALHGGPAALLGRPSLEDARGRSFRVCSWSSSASFLHGGAWGRSMDVGVRGRERGREEENRFCGGRVVAMAEVKEKTPPSADASPLVKLAWYGSEAFGKGVALFRGRDEREEVGEEEGETFGDSISRETAMAALRKDYDRSYFVTGIMSMGIYEEDCEFADPFVSFRGKKRFKQNVSNLGSFMEDVNLKILDWQESEKNAGYGEDKVAV